MTIGSGAAVDVLFKQIREWPVGDRLVLASRILESVRMEKGKDAATVTLADLRGLMAGEQASPRDADVDRWLEDERLRKFG